MNAASHPTSISAWNTSPLPACFASFGAARSFTRKTDTARAPGGIPLPSAAPVNGRSTICNRSPPDPGTSVTCAASAAPSGKGTVSSRDVRRQTGSGLSRPVARFGGFAPLVFAPAHGRQELRGVRRDQEAQADGRREEAPLRGLHVFRRFLREARPVSNLGSRSRPRRRRPRVAPPACRSGPGTR